MEFKEERIDITDWPAGELQRLDLERIERIERGSGKVVAVMKI